MVSVLVVQERKLFKPSNKQDLTILLQVYLDLTYCKLHFYYDFTLLFRLEKVILLTEYPLFIS